MSELNYEAIGRCVFLNRRINSHINAICDIKSSIYKSESPILLSDHPVKIDYVAVRMIEGAVIRHRQLLDEIAELVSEHNKYAVAAGIEIIELNISGQLNNQTGN